MARVVHWNGKSVPAELRELPAGDYILAEYHARKLSPDEEEGIRAALRSIDEGRSLPADEVHARIDRMLTRAERRRKG